MFGVITRATAIDGEHVAAGEVVEVNEDTFAALARCRSIREATPEEAEKATDGDEANVKKPRRARK